MNSLFFSALVGVCVQLAQGCTITAYGYGSSLCLIALGSETFPEEPQNTCYASDNGGYAIWSCTDNVLSVSYYDTEDDCNNNENGTTESYTEDTCQYSAVRGLYGKVTFCLVILYI